MTPKPAPFTCFFLVISYLRSMLIETAYTTRTSLIAHAIERYVASLSAVDDAPKLTWSVR
jgi:hypothetical protein